MGGEGSEGGGEEEDGEEPEGEGAPVDSCISLRAGDDEELMGEVDLVGVAAEPAEGGGAAEAGTGAQDAGEHDQAGTEGEDGFAEPGVVEGAEPVPGKKEHEESHHRDAEELDGEEGALREGWALA